MNFLNRLRHVRFLVLVVLPLISVAGAAEITLHAPKTSAPKYGKLEFDIAAPGSLYANPFDSSEVRVDLEITTPAGRSLRLPAFWHHAFERRILVRDGRERDWMYPTGRDGWKARFAPMEVGPHQAVAVIQDSNGPRSSAPFRFVCEPSTTPGFLRVSGKDPRFFELSEGQPFFALGQNLAFIGPQQYVTLPKAEEIFGKLAAHGANYLRIWTGSEDWALAVEARKSAWGRSWNWDPPFVQEPGSDTANRLCIELNARRRKVAPNPSHAITVRPETRYVITGRVRVDGQASVRLDAPGPEPNTLIGRPGDRGWTDFRREFTTGSEEFWFRGMTFECQGEGTAWLADLSMKEAGGGAELLWEADLNRPTRGFYSPPDCFMLDELLAAAESSGIYLQLCLFTRDLYMGALKEPNSPQYRSAIADAKKLLRYAVARWGYSTHVAAWEYWNEMDPGLPTDAFYTAAGEFLEQIDIYNHLRRTSTWGPSAKDCLHSELDVADVHFYLRPVDQDRVRDEVDAILERTRWLRAQAPEKPVQLGEFGLADDKWRLRDEMKQSPVLADFHNTLWASALSGAAGTAMPWWWERLDQRNAYPAYRPVSAFIADIPWTSGLVRTLEATASDPAVAVVGLTAEDRAWVWLFHRDGSWSSLASSHAEPAECRGLEIRVKNLPGADCHVQWWDTRQGAIIRENQTALRNGVLHAQAPAFRLDVACKILPTIADR